MVIVRKHVSDKWCIYRNIVYVTDEALSRAACSMKRKAHSYDDGLLISHHMCCCVRCSRVLNNERRRRRPFERSDCAASIVRMSVCVCVCVYEEEVFVLVVLVHDAGCASSISTRGREMLACLCSLTD